MQYTEVELLSEEMRRLLEFLEWDRDRRNKRVLHIHERADSATHCPTLLPSHGETAAFEEDLRAYPLRWVSVCQSLFDTFARQWHGVPVFVAMADYERGGSGR